MRPPTPADWPWLLRQGAPPRISLYVRGWREADLENIFSNCTSCQFQLQAFGVVGDMAYTAGLEHTSVSLDGQPWTFTLRATQVYRHEDGAWRVTHRHADAVTG